MIYDISFESAERTESSSEGVSIQVQLMVPFATFPSQTHFQSLM